MLGKKPKPMIGIFTGSLVSGNRSGITGLAATSPRTPSDSKPQSPNGPRAFDFGAVGLGIVAELEKTGGSPANGALFTRNLSRSIPIPVKNSSRNNSEEMETGSFEEYTIVTCHGPNKSYTKVNGGRKGDDRTPFRIQNGTVKSINNNRPSVFHISPPKFGETTAAPPSDFLSSCDLCNKKLHNEDIYMYRGERAFCSTECRYRQMVMDERKEKCGSESSIRPVVASSSPYANNGQIFTTGILAT